MLFSLFFLLLELIRVVSCGRKRARLFSYVCGWSRCVRISSVLAQCARSPFDRSGNHIKHNRHKCSFKTFFF